MKRILLSVLALLGIAVAGGIAWFQLHGRDAMQTAAFWEDEIVAFEAAGAEAPPEPGAIVFTGSSSIRLWSTLSADMAPMRVLNRGFGGAHMAHVVEFADRIVTPYAPRAVVVYAGDNRYRSRDYRYLGTIGYFDQVYLPLAAGDNYNPSLYGLEVKKNAFC